MMQFTRSGRARSAVLKWSVRRVRSCWIVVVAVAAGCRREVALDSAPVSASASVVAPAPAAPALHEEVVRIPLPLHPPMTLEATIFRPDGAGPFPLVILDHGAIGKRDPAPRWRPLAHARWFVSRGFVVLVPMRRGNAASDGDWAEGYGPCESADYTRANSESASDIRAALEFATAKPYVDRDRVLLHGYSAGGLAALALAGTSPPGVVGVLNFAGGRGSLTDDGGATRHNCSPSALVAAFSTIGHATHVPVLFLYGENDRFFPPPLAARLFDAFHAGDPASSFVKLPAFAHEGHLIGRRDDAIPLWSDAVDAFLHQLKLH
jgi:dienelactone hydrolase